MEQIEQLREVLADRYRVEREIGSGGMAIVYLAEDLKLHRPVAIKVLRPDIASAVGADRFLREIEIAQRLQHPFILKLYDSGQCNGCLFYVMPFVAGESLRARLDREGPLELKDALRIAREVADALSYAHQQGVVHRDIKPENILFEGGHAVVADFGVARAVSEAGDEKLTVSGHAVGTPSYMSPEQASGDRDLDGRTDVYALSCVLYEMLAGEQAFKGDSVQEIIKAQILDTPTPISEIAPHVPVPVVQSIDRALAKIPAQRFQTAFDFGTSLELPAIMINGARRRRILRWAIAVGSVAVLGLAIFALLGGFDRTHLDPNKVVVFPPLDRDNSASFAEEGRNVAIAIEVALVQAEPLRWVDGWDHLDEQVRRDPLLLTADVARAVARDRRAGRYIDGTLRADGDSLILVLNLHDVRGDEVLERAVKSGSSENTNVETLGLQAVLELLPSLVDPGRDLHLRALAGRDPAAIALFMQGEREYRTGHFLPALELYERALTQDSLIAFAAMKGALAATWEHEDDRAEILSEKALSQDTLLPTRYAHLARGIEDYLAGRADEAVAHYREALAGDSLWAEALTELGEIYYHMFPSESALDSLAEAAFERAVELDSGFTPPLLHLAQITLLKGEVQRGDSLIDRLWSFGFDESLVRRLEMVRDCVRDGADGVPWEEAAEHDSRTVLMAAKKLSVAGAQMECAERGFRAVLAVAERGSGYQWGALLGLQGVLVAEGRTAETEALLDSLEASGVSAARYLYVLDVFADPAFEARAAGIASLAREAYGDDYERANTQLRWLMGAWHARSGHFSRVERLVRGLRREAEARGGRKAQLLSSALEGHLALARGDTAQAMLLFSELTPTAHRETLLWDLCDPLAVEKLLLGTLLLRQGEYARAHDVAAIFDHQQPIIFLPYLAQSLAIRLEASGKIGEGHKANLYRDRLAALGRADLTFKGN